MLAQEAGIPIVPIVVRGSAEVLSRHGWEIHGGDDRRAGRASPSRSTGLDARRAHAAGARAPRAHAAAHAQPPRGAAPAGGGAVTGANGRPRLRVIPLGGLGEIGLNLLLLEYGDTAIAVDCGVMFPDEQMLGVDVAIPDLTYVRTLGDRFKAIFLTHGHEDHIGALPYVLGEFDVPVYGTPLTIGLRALAAARARAARPRWRSTRASRSASGPFAVEPFAVTHSIPDSVGLIVRTPVGTVVHTGDFKLDQTPLDGRLPDLRRLAEVGDEGVLLLMSDSTNVEHAGRHAVGALGRRPPRADLPRGRRPRRRHHLLVAHPSHAAGDRPRGAPRPQGRAGRPEPHVARRHGARPRAAARRRRHAGRPGACCATCRGARWR